MCAKSTAVPLSCYAIREEGTQGEAMTSIQELGSEEDTTRVKIGRMPERVSRKRVGVRVSLESTRDQAEGQPLKGKHAGSGTENHGRGSA